MGKSNLGRCVLGFDRNIDRHNKLRESGGRKFQDRRAMAEKTLNV